MVVNMSVLREIEGVTGIPNHILGPLMRSREIKFTTKFLPGDEVVIF